MFLLLLGQHQVKRLNSFFFLILAGLVLSNFAICAITISPFIVIFTIFIFGVTTTSELSGLELLHMPVVAIAIDPVHCHHHCRLAIIFICFKHPLHHTKPGHHLLQSWLIVGQPSHSAFRLDFLAS